MEWVEFEVDRGHFGVGDDDSLRVCVGVDVAGDGEAGVCGRRGDELDDDLAADERLAAPVLGDIGEEAVLDLVPFAGAGRQVGDGDGKAGLVGEALDLALPQADPNAIAAAAIGGDDEGLGLGIARPAQALPPAPDALDREGGRVGIDADIDPALVGGDVADAIECNLAQFRDLEVMDPNGLGVALGTQFPAIVLEVADPFLLLGIDRDGRLAGGDSRPDRGIDVLELGVAVRVAGAFAGLRLAWQLYSSWRNSTPTSFWLTSKP